jgi:hypothetical protein
MFRIVTINLEQDHKRWMERRKLICAELATINPDIISFNEVCVPLQSAKILRDAITSTTGISYNLVQQTKVNGLSEVEGEALLTRYPVIETGNLDYQTRDMVALVARVLIDAIPVDMYVTHLFKSRGDDSLRLPRLEPGPHAGERLQKHRGSTLEGKSECPQPNPPSSASRVPLTKKRLKSFWPAADGSSGSKDVPIQKGAFCVVVGVTDRPSGHH